MDWTLFSISDSKKQKKILQSSMNECQFWRNSKVKLSESINQRVMQQTAVSPSHCAGATCHFSAHMKATCDSASYGKLEKQTRGNNSLSAQSYTRNGRILFG